MNRKALLVMWSFLCISGIILRKIDDLITPAMLSLFFQETPVVSIFYIRTICEFFCTLVLFSLFLWLRPLYSSFSDSELTLSTRSVVLYIILLAILLKLSKDNSYYSFLLWVVSFPVEGYLNLVSMLSGTYDTGRAPILLFAPSVLSPYLFLSLLKRNKKRIEQD